MVRCGNLLPLLFLFGAGFPLFAAEKSASQQATAEILAYRASQNARFRGEKSPLAVERVVILRKENNTLGSDAAADVKLAAPGVPKQAAVATVKNGVCTIRLLDPTARINDDPKLRERSMRSTDWVAIGPYRLRVRHPEGQFALRISNVNNPALKVFHGLDYYPIDLNYRVPATFHKYPTERHMTVEATQGGPQDYILAGYLDFRMQGQPLRLEALIDPDEPNILFVIFKDGTNGRGSYKVGRYIDIKMPPTKGAAKPTAADKPFTWSDIPSNLSLVLDFNQSYNPLCAYGPFFFCPIPPRQNRLPIDIPAGEKDYRAH